MDGQHGPRPAGPALQRLALRAPTGAPPGAPREIVGARSTAGGGSGRATLREQDKPLNERIVAGVEHRLLRVLWFVSLLQPDVLCVEELDNFSWLAERLGADVGANVVDGGVSGMLADELQKAQQR